MTTIFVLPHEPRQQQITGRFPELFNLVHNWSASPLANPEPILSSRGTLPYLLLYQLGHDEPLAYPQTLQPADIRVLRDLAWQARVQGGRLHLFGVLDHGSPVGSRRLIDQTVHSLGKDSTSIIVHLGRWHATPKEQKYAAHDIQGYGNAVELGSIFDWSMVHSPAHTRNYITYLHQPNKEKIDGFEHVEPTHKPYVVYHPEVWQPEDVAVIVNHHPAGFGHLLEHIHAHRSLPLHALSSAVPSSPSWTDALNTVSVYSTDNHYPEYFFGSAVHNQVQPLEDLSQNSEAQHTYVFIDDRAANNENRWIDGIYKRASEPMAVYWLEPFRLNQHSVFTNF